MRFYLSKLPPLLVVLALLASALFSAADPARAASPAQTLQPQEQARALLARLTPEERVGQLFLATFTGIDLRDTTAIYQLVNTYHIGGVVLSRENNNFDDREDLLRQVYTLTTGLQQIESQSTGSEHEYVPLLIGISQEGDRSPSDQLLSGVTPLPSLMALGAAWDVDITYQTGQILGRDLSALGVNLLLGPSLDVVDETYREGITDLGTRTFGGDPYWVSRLGQTYVAGVHSGSNNRVAVVAKHFPGMGSSDRDPQAEIPTVRKSLEQLKRVELAPFFGVTGGAPQAESMVDGLYLSHIRYQGFQGNIRDITTRPISFDQSALSDILKLDQFNQWRGGGGLLVSDNLGSPALRRFFDPTGSNFDARQVARNALMAGNDLLYADGLVSSTDPDSFTTLSRTIEFFTQTYREDAAFAQRVDAAVERILTLKFRLYPQFDIAAVLPAEADLGQVGSGLAVTTQLSAGAATLINPSAAELTNILSRPPAANERIVFLTDDQTVRQCSGCADISTIPADALQSAVLRLYGTQTGGVISRNLLQSYSFADLYKLFLQQTEPPAVEESLRLANWIVVAVQQTDPDRPESTAFQRLLSERPDLVRNKRVVVFAMNAPYYLDATDISKISAYYGLYAKSTPFIDLAARILFQEHLPSGASPVSIPGVGYDLVEITRPDPQQVISLILDEPVTAPSPGSLTATPVPSFNLGDTLRLRTSVLLDHNQNPVPDGTVVRFFFAVGNEAGLAQVIEAQTVDGVARVAYKIERGELLEITANSDPALNSIRMLLDITGSQSAVITVIAPTPQPSPTSLPTLTPSPTPTLTPTPQPTPPPSAGMGDWVLALAAALGGAVLITWVGMFFINQRWALRAGLCALVGGLLGFNYLALELPGSQSLLEQSPSAALLLTLVGAALGAGAGLAWRWLALRQFKAAGMLPTPNRSTKPPADPSSREDQP